MEEERMRERKRGTGVVEVSGKMAEAWVWGEREERDEEGGGVGWCQRRNVGVVEVDDERGVSGVALAAILVSSAIGVCIPVLGKAIPALSPYKNFFFIIKAFAAGVILATGFIHVLPDAFESLTSPCLKEHPWGDFPFSGFLAMVVAMGTLMVDTCATSYYNKKGMKSGVVTQSRDEEGAINVHSHAAHGHAHGSLLVTGDSESELLRYRVISQVLELGIIVHSVTIGIALGASGSPKTIRPLIGALTFHQFFEGMRLGGSIAQVITHLFSCYMDN
ncbi:zinc transporter 1-like [Lycium barbarum]|uniref:zinc transporter 1-like n=1 Tax=Lycium barbarum TaxID=112863 RepID=UPI00293ED67E|nr:zinc transporter 1-like [Lycium barbarum]